jgi:hypothetical protein
MDGTIGADELRQRREREGRVGCRAHCGIGYAPSLHPGVDIKYGHGLP